MKELIEKTKVQNIIQQRKRKRDNNSQESSAEEGREGLDGGVNKKLSRKFKQTTVLGKLYDDNEYKLNKSVLKSIFAKPADE